MTSARAAALGLALTVAMAIWWLPGVADCLRSGTDPAALSSQLLAALLTLRLLALCVLTPWVAGSDELGRSGTAPRPALLARTSTLALMCAMAWPLVLLAQWSSAVPATAVIAAEAALLMAAALGALLAAALQRLPLAAQARHSLGLFAGLACASLCWLSRDSYLGWLFT